jgi:hypothetical protein
MNHKILKHGGKEERRKWEIREYAWPAALLTQSLLIRDHPRESAVRNSVPLFTPFLRVSRFSLICEHQRKSAAKLRVLRVLHPSFDIALFSKQKATDLLSQGHHT